MSLFSTKHAVLFGLTAATLASPLPRSAPYALSRRQDNTTEPVQSTDPVEPDVSVEDFCANVDLKSIDGAKAVWNDRGVGAFHDEYLSADNYANEGSWLDKMASDAFPTSGDTGSFGCGQRDQACFNSLPDCQTMFGQGKGKEWWIFNSVQKMQDVFERAHENLQDSVIDSSLSVSGIAKDFSVTLTSTSDILKYVAAAFGMAGGFVGYGSGALVNGLKTSATMFGGAFTASAVQTQSPPDATAELDRALRSIFQSQRDQLDSYLALAVGEDGDKTALPDRGLIAGADPKSAIAGFFADGRFLLQGEDINGYFSAGYDFMTKKLVDLALQEYGYRVLADHNYEDAESCAGNHGAFWMDIDGGRCMRLTYKDGDNSYPIASDEVVNKIQDTYGINVFDYFTAACDCAINGSGEVDIGTLPDDGSPPQCFYNIGCQDAELTLESDDVTWTISWPIDFNEVMSWDN